MAGALELQELDAEGARAAAAELGALMADCVAGGASLHFTALSPPQGEAFFSSVAEEVADGRRVLIVARQDGVLVGTVQLSLATPPNQQHRAVVNKLMVAPQARGRGLGEALMRALEEAARARGRVLLDLDTIEGEAGERLYQRMGWTRVGAIPGYAYAPSGQLCATVIFFKRVD